MLDALSRDLKRRRAEGPVTDRLEHHSRVRLEPGQRRRLQDGRLLLKAVRRRVTITDDFIRRLDLPPNVAYFQASSHSDRQSVTYAWAAAPRLRAIHSSHWRSMRS